MNKPYAESCDQNRDSILEVLQPLLIDNRSVIEIGSGTGQHAIYFAQKMPHLIWHTSDCKSYLSGIELWLEEAGLENVRSPLEFDVNDSVWPELKVDCVFTANSVHIMSIQSVEALFAGVGNLLLSGGQFIVYGPFNYDQSYTSESNEKFDVWLKSRDPKSCIKNFEDVCHLAEQAGMMLAEDIEMPANNRILHWKKI